jgi:hypothetical protein
MDNSQLMSPGQLDSSLPVAQPVAGYAGHGNSAGLPVAQSVAQAMPSAPPIASLRDQWSGQAQGQFEDHGAAPSGKSDYGCAMAPVAQANFYTPQEMQALQATAVPVDTFQRNFDGPVQTATPVAQVAVAQAVPVFTTAVGVPIYPQEVRSLAETEQDGSEGVKSSDECLSNVPEIMAFLNTYNARPRIACHVHGYHRERRHRTERYTDDEGNERERRVECVSYRTLHLHSCRCQYYAACPFELRLHTPLRYWETVTDFDYKIDMTQFIFPYGYIQSVTPGMAVPQLVEVRYIYAL